MYPKVLKNSIFIRIAISMLFLAFAVICCFINFNIQFVLPPIVIGVVSLLSCLQIYYLCKNGNYTVYEGTITDIQYANIITRASKYVYFASEGKVYKIPLKRKRLKIGDRVAVYANKKAQPYMYDGFVRLSGVFAVEV